MVKKIASRVYMGLIFLFLYLPIVVLIVLSFNNSKSKVKWGGFTLDWYIKCFQSERIMSAFSTTLQITLLAAVISTIIGTLAAMGISAMKKRNQTIYLGATNIPMLNADIVTGISMMLLFVKFMNLGFVTVLIAHITFNIPYVILNVLPKLKQTNKYTYEAALDLGASPLYAFFKVTWPEISPGVFSGFMMAVTMSLDDFSITYFTKGAGDVVLFKITRIIHKIVINREVADLDIRIGNNIFEIDRLPVAAARINQIRIHGFTSIYCLYVSNPAASQNRTASLLKPHTSGSSLSSLRFLQSAAVHCRNPGEKHPVCFRHEGGLPAPSTRSRVQVRFRLQT